MRLGNCHFQRTANEGETAANLVTEALVKVLKLQLLVVILPEKSLLYGRSFELFIKCLYLSRRIIDHVMQLFTLSTLYENQSGVFQTRLGEVIFFITENINL